LGEKISEGVNQVKTRAGKTFKKEKKRNLVGLLYGGKKKVQNSPHRPLLAWELVGGKLWGAGGKGAIHSDG